MNKQLLAAVASFLCLTTLRTFAAENLVLDPYFGTVGQPASAWHLAADKDGRGEPAKAADGKVAAVHLKAAAVTQQVTVPAGLFELTVEGRGGGELILGVSGAGERTQMLGKEWGTFGYLFQADAGARTVTIRVAVEGTVTAAAVRPATAEQAAAWERAQKSLQQFGFITVSAQRSSPGLAPLELTDHVKPLMAMTKFAVLDEPRLNTHNGVVNVDRLVRWLGDNGFERLDGEKLPAWMAERIKQGDAYGSVAVLPRGVSPLGIFFGAQLTKPLWLEYIRSGGRIVHLCDWVFNFAESTLVAAVDTETESRGANILGLHYDWGSPYCGDGGLPVTATRAAREWGLELWDSAILGVPIENVSFAFHVYTVPSTGKQGAADWFRNVRPDMPWSGLVKMLQNYNGNDDAALRDVWRATHYIGQPVTTIPPMPPPIVSQPPKLSIQTVAGGMTNRHEFVRGEKVAIAVVADASLKADEIRVELLDAGKTVLGVPPSVGMDVPPPKSGTASFRLDTSPYADGAYSLRVAAMAGGKLIETASSDMGIRYLPPEGFNWEVDHSAGLNPLRTDMEFADINQSGLELYLTAVDVAGVDAAVRNHLGFSLRASPNFLIGKEVTFEKNPEYFRLDNEGKPILGAYSGGRPTPGISHPEILGNAFQSIENQVKAVAGLPSLRPYVLCNDDFVTVYYGWDYSPHVLQAFKAATGLDAPRKRELSKTFGPVPDNDPWVKWFQWTLINVDGAYNKAETAGAIKALPNVRIGPIPGGMNVPLAMLMEQPAEYPPYNFGQNGFNLICSYNYNSYWQPIMTDTFWMEIGRMGNRDLPEWNLGDLYHTAGYTRNNLFHYLAGGVSGLVYFTYRLRNENAWPEFQRLNKAVRRIGPVQVALKPARRDIGLLNSFTSDCLDPGHTLIQVYGYHNLMQAHFSVEMVSEDEILAGRASQYKAVLLYNVKYLRQSVYDALVKHAASGGLVLLDRSVPFDIPGAKRLSVDLGMGEQSTKPFPSEGAHLSTPGIRDYGHPDRIAVIQKAISEYVKPQFDSADIRVVACPFAIGEVPYTWFVNAHDGKEYMFCRERQGAGQPGAGTPEKVKELCEWEVTETAKGPYVTTVEYDSVPGVPYDLVSGKKLPFVKTKSGRYALTLSMERFGGSLVVWLPKEINAVQLTAPKTAAANQPVRVRATVLAQGKPVAGTVAVEFVLRDPKGNESIVSGVRGAKNGAAEFDWTPAVNDPVGKWILRATELASGKTAKVVVELRSGFKTH